MHTLPSPSAQHIPHHTAVLFALLVLSLMLASATPAGAERKEALDGGSFAVMPCRLGKAPPYTPANRKDIIDCTLAELCSLEGEPLQDAAEIITGLLQQELQQRFGPRVLPLDSVRLKFEGLPVKADQTLRGAAVQLGRELNVDFVLAAALWRFDERIGDRTALKNLPRSLLPYSLSM